MGIVDLAEIADFFELRAARIPHIVWSMVVRAFGYNAGFGGKRFLVWGCEVREVRVVRN